MTESARIRTRIKITGARSQKKIRMRGLPDGQKVLR